MIRMPETLFYINRECESTFNIITCCLCPDPDRRPDATTLLQFEYFQKNSKSDKEYVHTNERRFWQSDVIRVWKEYCHYEPPEEL